MTFLMNELKLFFTNEIVQGMFALCGFAVFFAFAVTLYERQDTKKTPRA